ncbi:RluA family pseudouridine synthase [Roseibacillus persicicus]|uniref:Pseudouridine synthase RsuA/RluA-like domain-containing protein n=1 Tax=Roseibacillus persicicus TaxID=454148 RepID=A0A918TVF3_9BACT|nr:RluA family pseudouridine synthase [Roseibacillus persicicus]GHC63120.1 hypothetical protein GCM10007100_33220 [Roseibacillus persicicus]
MERARKEELEARWKACCDPLPGGIPYVNRRPCRIKAKEGGRRFIEILAERFPGKLSEEEWLQVFRDELIVRKATGEPVTDPHLLVTTGHQYERLLPDWVEPEVGTDLKVIHEDEVLLIIDKPAPIPMHEGGRFCKNTLMWLMNQAWPELDVRYAHRLDAETSGALVCVKGRDYRSAVQLSFEQGDVFKSYLARIQGWPDWEKLLIENDVPAEGRVWGKPLQAATEVKLLERCPDGTALVEARPLTGRTHQIRVHLWQEGFPIVGDRLYLPGRKLGVAEIAGMGAEPLALRSWKIAFPHPVTGKQVGFEAEGGL